MKTTPLRARAIIFLFLLGGVLMVGVSALVAVRNQRRLELPVAHVVLAGETYTVEVARTDAEKMRGLMYRNHMDADKGMIFIYAEPQPLGFWMKNTKIPLDILYFNGQFELVSQNRDTPPCQKAPCPTYPSQTNAQYVLELNAGQAKALNLQEGDRLTLADQR